MKKENATLKINFSDDTSKSITLKKVIIVDTPGKQELSFRETANGEWIMAVTKSLLENKQLANQFLEVSKIPE